MRPIDSPTPHALEPAPPHPGAAPPTPARDSFLDAVKAVAIARVVMWHTWSWWWLSWIAAMPAMFFAAGALLDQSVERHGFPATARSRLRRLLVPFWVYGGAAVTVMVAVGWRPDLRELAAWIVPLGDPTGSADTPGLWVPLWYLRAYLWFLLATPLLRAGVTRLGRGVLLLAVGATLAVWLARRHGTDVPLALSDAAGYSFFVLAGMLYHRRGAIPSRLAIGLGASAAFGALAWWAAFGPSSRVVNESYPLQVLVGCALLAALIAGAALIAPSRGPLHRVVRFIGGRALSIYLWQGFGLVAADRLVTRQGIDGPRGALAAIVVVVVVTSACVAAFGWVEDAAAGRPVRLPQLRLAPVAVAGVACLVAAVAVAPAPGTSVRPPPSGQAVVARGGFIDEQLDRDERAGDDPAAGPPRSADARVRLELALDDWTTRHRSTLESLGTSRIDVTVAAPTGEVIPLQWAPDGAGGDGELVAWWSISKALTTAWLSELADAGVVALDDPLARYLPDVPHGERITLDVLARHRSGIPREAESGLFHSNPLADLQSWFTDPRLDFEPGTDFEYSRLGYFLLAWALEEASGTSWVETVDRWAAAAQVRLVLDEEIDPQPEPTHPGGGDYRGRLWASGAVNATRDDSVRFFRWLMTEGLSEQARASMATFAVDESAWYYGLGLLPLCPCERDGEWLRSTRYGLDAPTGSFAFDEATTATVFLTPDTWFDDDGPRPEFYELEQDLLDAAG